MTVAVNEKLEMIVNRIDTIENGVNSLDRTIDSLEIDNGCAFITVKKSKVKLLRYLLRRRSTIESIFEDLGTPSPTEQELTDLVNSIQPFDLEVFESSDVPKSYGNAFAEMRVSAMGFLASHDMRESGYYRLFKKFPLCSCMVDKPKGDLTHKPKAQDSILGLYDAVNYSESFCWVRGIKYRVSVRSISGFLKSKPRIEISANDKPVAKLDMFRSLVWHLEPANGGGETIRILDKVYQTNSNLLADIKQYLGDNYGITHTREHNHLTDAGDCDSVAFLPLNKGSRISGLEIGGIDYSVDSCFPYVDSFKYVEHDCVSKCLCIALEPSEDTTHVAESTHGGISEFDGIGRRCDHCDCTCCAEDLMYSERLGQSLCDSCFCELIAHCDHCSAEMEIGGDTIYRLPDHSTSCDSCTVEV